MNAVNLLLIAAIVFCSLGSMYLLYAIFGTSTAPVISRPPTPPEALSLSRPPAPSGALSLGRPPVPSMDLGPVATKLVEPRSGSLREISRRASRNSKKARRNTR